MARSSRPAPIPEAILGANFRAISDVIVIGGAVLELANLRLANDIDIVTTVDNMAGLLIDQPKRWQEVHHAATTKLSLDETERRSIVDQAGQFDIWSYWIDSGQPVGSQLITIDQLRARSWQHPVGFWVVNLDYLAELKQAANRHAQEAQDVQMIRRLLAKA